VDEGDVLYFPPQWVHAVITSKGPNFMLNLRNGAFLKSLFANPFRFLEWGLATAIEKSLVFICSHQYISLIISCLYVILFLILFLLRNEEVRLIMLS
jgi:hypothetical protein